MDNRVDIVRNDICRTFALVDVQEREDREDRRGGKCSGSIVGIEVAGEGEVWCWGKSK